MSSSASSPATSRKPPPLLLFRLAAMAVAAPLLMRAGLPRVQQWLEPRHPPHSPPEEADRVGEQLAAWVESIIRRGHPLVRPGCLTRGLTLYYQLRREGIDVALCFGVGPHEGDMAGHCWLDYEGRAFLERVDPLAMFTEVVRMSRQGVTN